MVTMEALLGQPTAEIERIAQEFQADRYRARQIAAWLYRKRAVRWDEMTDLPRGLRSALAERWSLRTAGLARRDAAADGTVKYLLALADSETVETVYLPYEDRVSVCVSTQVGCPARCAFCATGMGGFARNLTAGEIVEQMLIAQDEHPERRVSHVVFMGMGEPLLNYGGTAAAARLLTREIGLSARNVTISTVGVPPAIRMLAAEGMPLTLALSLHAPDDELRERLIPLNRKWRTAEVLDACGEYHARTKRNLTFEYLLLAGVNDSVAQARALGSLLRDLPGNVNLIPFNHVSTPEGFRRPEPARVAAFRAALEATGRTVTQRMERGHAISAACGQLRRAESGALRPDVGTPFDQ